MNPQALFGLSALMSLLAWILVTKLYVWPRLRPLPRQKALALLVIPHTFRFIGLSFLVPGVASPALPAAFAVPAAYGDLAAMALAFVATIALVRGASPAIPLTWLFNVWGTADLLYAIYDGNAVVRSDPGMFGATFFIPTVVVPGLLVAHALTFRLLLERSESGREPRGEHP